MAKNASPSYEHLFYINGTGISGVRDLNFSYNVSRLPVNSLGIGHVQPVLAEALVGEVSFSRDFIYQDPILYLTGDTSVNGSIIYASDLQDSVGQVIGFTSGYLNSYSISASVGSTPTTQCSFTVFGQLGSGVRQGELDYSGSSPINVVGFINQGSINAYVEQSETNRIVDFSQSFAIKRTPIYDLKEKTSQNYYAPTQVITETPIEVDTNFTVEIDDYETANMIDNIRSGVYKKFSLGINLIDREVIGLQDHNSANLKDHDDNVIEGSESSTVYDFLSVSGNLISESVSTSVDGLLTVNLQFKNYYK